MGASAAVKNTGERSGERVVSGSVLVEARVPRSAAGDGGPETSAVRVAVAAAIAQPRGLGLPRLAGALERIGAAAR